MDAAGEWPMSLTMTCLKILDTKAEEKGQGLQPV